MWTGGVPRGWIRVLGGPRGRGWGGAGLNNLQHQDHEHEAQGVLCPLLCDASRTRGLAMLAAHRVEQHGGHMAEGPGSAPLLEATVLRGLESAAAPGLRRNQFNALLS